MTWAKSTSRRKTIPALSSPNFSFDINDYSKGMDNYTSNDKFPFKNGGSNFWRLAQNARIISLGDYDTRKGIDFHSAAAGETLDDSEQSTTGAADQTFSETRRLAQKFTASADGRLHKLDIRLKNANSATGTPIVEVWSNDGGEPDTLLGRSSIAASAITGSYAYVSVLFNSAPEVSNGSDYWIVVYVQSVGSNTYSFSSTTNSTDALLSTDSGVTWSSQSFSLNFKQYYATAGPVKGMIRAYKNDGTKVTVFAHDTSLYSVNNVTGALTTIKSGLNASATHYRFKLVNDVLYYINGFDGYRKWDFTTESQISATNYNFITEHKGLMFLVEKDDPNKIIFSNFAAYETFTSTDFVYVPSPKTGDPVTGLQPLNGYLIIPTLNNKFILYGSDEATFELDEAPDQNGTFTQETICTDYNYAYYLSHDGVYRSNGTEPELISRSNYQAIIDLPNKDEATIMINRGRLYLWYRDSSSSSINQCYVWNINYSTNTVESLDTKTYIGRAFNAYEDDESLLVGSSVIGQVYWQETDSNDYSDIGGDIDYLLETHYIKEPSAAVFKAFTDWIPRFAAQSDNYTIDCEYATDRRDNWTLHQSLSIQGSGEVYGGGETYGGGATYGTSAETELRSYVPGQYKRIALRYKHYAARQPHSFLGHTLTVQSRRVR